jgi:glycosyltransferase involved in cell wall biosynthesis
MKNNPHLTVALAVYNEEKNLPQCLSSIVDFADEIIVVDGGSTDTTVEIAKKFGATIITTDNPPMFHINKQKALDASHGVWILQLDADEVVTPGLKKEIRQIIDLRASGLDENDTMIPLNSKTQALNSNINGYFIPRKNYFWGRFMTKGGTYPDEVIRLLKNGYAKFPCKSVHEQIEITGGIGHLSEPMLHYSYRNRNDYWKKADTYTTLTAQKLKSENRNSKKDEVKIFFTYCLWLPIYTFLALYIRHKGFMDGVQGFEFALYSALHFPIAYKKFLAINRNGGILETSH